MRSRNLIIVVLFALLPLGLSLAQDTAPTETPAPLGNAEPPYYPLAPTVNPAISIDIDPGDLQLDFAQITTQTDVYGLPAQVVKGTLTNNGADALTNITLFADLLDADDEFIGEGIGYVVNACGVGLLSDFALQPGASQSFSLALEIFEEDAELAHVQIIPQVTAAEPVTPAALDEMPAVTEISREEVVNVEWADNNNLLRYGVGCDADAFTYLDWYEYSLLAGQVSAIENPDAARITEGFLRNTRIDDPYEYRRSFLQFAPASDRVLFQSEVNHFYTANPDGSGRQFIWDNISRFSLHGILWQDNDVFLAYYYGAYGEPVLYFTASARNGRISRDVYVVAPSDIVPAPTTFGTHVIMGATFDEVEGYYYRHVFLTERRLLFEADLPGNNWPAPIYEDVLTPDAVVYITRPVDGEARLQCFNMEDDQLIDLTAIPLDLTTDDRAWTWLSPDGTKIALAANGVSGGLWVIDLAALPVCAE